LRDRFTCLLIICIPIDVGISALEHYSKAVEAIFVYNTGLKVFISSTLYDIKELLLAAIE
jgi:pyruvate/2-oxoglutarate/acetoin dehydrogenase E1 component